VLFSFSDRAAQEKLGLFREWRAPLIRPAAPPPARRRNGPANPRRTGALPRSEQEGPGP